MRRIRNNSSVWLSVARRNLERFRRIASWPNPLGMRFHLSRSPVLRDRIWLLERLQPRVRINLYVTGSIRLSSITAAPMSTPVMRGSSMISRVERPLSSDRGSVSRVPIRESAPGLIHTQRHRAPAVREIPAPNPPGVPMQLNTQPSAVSQAAAPPLTARLVRRADRVDELPTSVPKSLARRQAALPQAIAAQSFNETPGSRAMPLPPGVSPMSAWPGQPAPASPVNVEQLTDQVLRQLDRRLIASRERMGRI